MIIIGLTGGIACGKSTVSAVFVQEGLPVLDCDVIAREVVEPGTSARKQIVAAFAKDVPELELPDGTLNRKALGQVVFADAEKRKVLTSITGKAIFARLARSVFYHWLIGTPVVVIDAPTLYETKSLVRYCKEVIVLAATKETQLARLMKRDGSNVTDATNRIKAQMPIEEKVKLADVVIWNEGTQEELTQRAREEATRLRKRGYEPQNMMLSGPGLIFMAAACYLLVSTIRG